MKRHLVFVVLALALALSQCGCGGRSASGAPAVTIQDARVGFPAQKGVRREIPPGMDGDRFKPGHWTPVYVTLQAGPQGLKAGQYALVTTTADVDNVRNQFAVTLPDANKDEKFTVVTYVKPSNNPEIKLTVHEWVKGDEKQPGKIGGQVGDAYGEDQHFFPRPADSVIYLAVGADLPRLAEAILDEPNGANATEYVASLDTVSQMPKEWIGYDGVDVVFLGTSDRTGFTEKLVGDSARWNALAEWVRRGGKLVISAGRTQNLVRNLDQQQPLLPMTLTGKKVPLPVDDKHLAYLNWTEAGGDFRLTGLGRDGKVSPIQLAELRPKNPSDEALKPDDYRQSVQISPNPKQSKDPPLMVRGPYGLGQVILVTADLDGLPLQTDQSNTSGFWKSLRMELGTYQQAPAQNPGGFMGPARSASDVATHLEQSLEHFADIPVIGFGWVALFILLYIIVVGPLDYLFLKKVLKRLELTWITFPAVVIVISVLAYFTAYWIKGDKLKINKVDVVDIDLNTDQVYGHTWFTLFSPRIDHYTIGVEPVAPQWAPGEPGDPRTLVSWMDRPEMNVYGRSRSQSFFRRSYDYAPDAAGLDGVPIQVWSTKSFEASWQVPAHKQLFTSTLHHPAAPDPKWISGTITSHLAVDLHDTVVFYDNQWYRLGVLHPEVETRLDGLHNGSRNMVDWYQPPDLPAPLPGAGPGGAAVQPIDGLMKRALFYQDAVANGGPQGQQVEHNASLRALDQSWRLRHGEDELIVYGRVPVQDGEAKKVAEAPGSPSRLWLHELPQSGRKWPGLSGTLRQETYVRIFIPVFAEPKAGK